MKKEYLISHIRSFFCWLLAVLLLLSCRKEKMPSPSNLDESYFVIKDNPNDPVDHAIFGFYQNTGIACFYNDTIHKDRLSDVAGQPRYSYVKLALGYTPFSTSNLRFKPVSARNNIPDLLQLLQQEILPKLPSNMRVPSILFLDSFWHEVLYPVVNIQIDHGWTSCRGFNTIGICVKELGSMSGDEKRMYAASMLAGMAEKQLVMSDPGKLQTEFFSISRAAAKNIMPLDIYYGIQLMFLFAPNMEPAAQTLGILRYPQTDVSATLKNLATTPRESDDIRAFLTAVFYYTPQEFTNLYSTHALILKKFSIIRKLVTEAGFRVPD